jgi:hypothetical protein
MDFTSDLPVEGEKEDKGDTVHSDQVHPVDVDGDVKRILKIGFKFL